MVTMGYWYSYLFIALASAFKACADTFENTPNFNESIFKKLNKKFWCKDVSWQYAKVLAVKIPFVKKKFGSYKVDSWHLSITLMVCMAAAAIVAYVPHHEWWVHYVSIGVIWNVVFVLFYHIIFQVK
jgi:hypothetical protein